MHRTFRLLRPPALVRPSVRSSLAARAARPVTSHNLSPILVRSPVLIRLSGVRFYADSKSSTPSKPASDGKPSATEAVKQTAEEAMNTTAKAVDEIKGVARDVADMISGKSGLPEPEQQAMPKDTTKHHQMSGMEVSSHSHGGSASQDFATITRTMVTSVPKPTLYFGLAGTLPYLGTSAGIVLLAREAHRASLGLKTFSGLDLDSALANLHTLEHIQITYGAIILSFLGALHWGMEFAKLGGSHGYNRLIIGTLPVLFAWPTTFLSHGVALAVQWAGFTGMWLLDQRASTHGWTPSWYSTYRFYLSIIVGFSIIATFVGTGYYGAGAGAATDLKKHRKHGYAIGDEPKSTVESLAQKKEKKKGAGKVAGKVGGDVSVEESDTDEGYGKIKNTEKEKEKEQKEEEEKRKTEEAQDKKDEKQMDKAPGDMKSDAKDRTGKNANVSGGEEEKEQGGSEGNAGKGKQGKKEESGSDKEKKSDDGKDKKADDKKDGKKEGGDDKTEKGSNGGESGEDKGKSQEKKDSPDKKPAAGEKNTAMK